MRNLGNRNDKWFVQNARVPLSLEHGSLFITNNKPINLSIPLKANIYTIFNFDPNNFDLRLHTFLGMVTSYIKRPYACGLLCTCLLSRNALRRNFSNDFLTHKQGKKKKKKPQRTEWKHCVLPHQCLTIQARWFSIPLAMKRKFTITLGK